MNVHVLSRRFLTRTSEEAALAHEVDEAVMARWEEEVRHHAPSLRRFGEYTTMASFGLGGLSLLGGRTISVLDFAIDDDSPSDTLLRFATPVLEPFLEGMSAPMRWIVPGVLGGVFMFGASCFSLGFHLGKRESDRRR